MNVEGGGNIKRVTGGNIEHIERVNGWQYKACEQGGNIECVNRWQYRV